MKYRIEYNDGRHCDYANGSKDLVKRLKDAAGGSVSDVRKVFKSGATDSVMDIYGKHIGK